MCTWYGALSGATSALRGGAGYGHTPETFRTVSFGSSESFRARSSRPCRTPTGTPAVTPRSANGPVTRTALHGPDRGRGRRPGAGRFRGPRTAQATAFLNCPAASAVTGSP
ncbi:hypothetical protein GCM10019017_69620 [Streptomyces showdoensis]